MQPTIGSVAAVTRQRLAGSSLDTGRQVCRSAALPAHPADPAAVRRRPAPPPQLYRFLVRRTDSDFNKVVLRRLFMSKVGGADGQGAW